jgi:hypothetical protein
MPVQTSPIAPKWGVRVARALTLASTLALAACSGGGGSAGTATGTLGVSITDAPACGFDAVNVTVSRVRVHASSSASESDGGWVDIPVNRKINLLQLNNGVLDKLGEVPLQPGKYTQLRLVLDPNTVAGLANSVLLSGQTNETPLITPSAVQSGIKLVHEFTVVAGQRADVLLDFDACKSVVRQGNSNYALKPVIQVIPFVLNGIDGYVDTALLTDGVTVTAQQNGAIVRATAPNATTGEFFLARLPVGSYDVVFTANNRTSAVIAAVPVVSATSVSLLSTVGAPIALPASASNTVSGSATLNPTSATEVAYVQALQTVGSVTPVVTIQWTAANDSSAPAGAYSLNLPTAAPLLGQYSSTLPIGLVAQTARAGLYSIGAVATGYQSQTVNVDISGAAVTQDFVLTP